MAIKHTINGVDPQLLLRAGMIHAAEYERVPPVTPQRGSAKQPRRVSPLNGCLSIRAPPAWRISHPDNQDSRRSLQLDRREHEKNAAGPRRGRPNRSARD